VIQQEVARGAEGGGSGGVAHRSIITQEKDIVC